MPRRFHRPVLSLAEVQRRNLLRVLVGPIGDLHPSAREDHCPVYQFLDRRSYRFHASHLSMQRGWWNEVLADVGLSGDFALSRALWQELGFPSREEDPEEPMEPTDVCSKIVPSRQVFSLAEAQAVRVMNTLHTPLSEVEMSKALRKWVENHLGDIRFCELVEYTERMLEGFSGLGKFGRSKRANELRALVVDRGLVFGLWFTKELKAALTMDARVTDPREPAEPTRALSMTDAERKGVWWGTKVFRSRADVISTREHLLTQRALIDQQIQNLDKSFLPLFPP